MQDINLPRTLFKQTIKICLTSEERASARKLWSSLMTGDFEAACQSLEQAPASVREAVRAAIRMRNEDGHDHENPFV